MPHLRGRRVVLRPLRADEIDVLLAFWDEDRVGRAPVPGDARRRLERRVSHRGEFREGRMDLGIEADGRLVGQIEARHPRSGDAGGVFELGIALFSAARGKGYGSDAIAALTAHLFGAMAARRVTGSTAVRNAAMRRVFEKLGFSEDGLVPKFLPGPDGEPEDYVVYTVTRDDWRAP